MSAPLPVALRARSQKLVAVGSGGRAAALRLELSPATGARRGLSIRRTGHARAAPRGRPRGKGRLDPHRALLIELIGQDGDITTPGPAAALADATGVQAHPDAIGRFLRTLGSRAKGTLVATGRRRATARRQRDHWFRHRLPAVSARPERAVLVDETSLSEPA